MFTRDVPIASPCSADWQKMTPADKGRFCADCNKVVRDLSSLTESEAKQLLGSVKNEALCVRYLYDAHGRLFFSDRPAPLVSATLLSRAKRAATFALAPALAACAPEPLGASRDYDSSQVYQMTGGAAYDPSAVDPAAPDAAAETDAGSDAAIFDVDADAGRTDAAATDAAADGGAADADMPVVDGEARTEVDAGNDSGATPF